MSRPSVKRVPAETRTRIEDEAIRLFAERGFAGTSTRDIAGAVGVTEGALYRHFPSKDAIARDVFLKRYRALAAEIRAIAGEERAFAPRIHRLVDVLFRMMESDPAGFTFVLLTQHTHLQYVPRDPDHNLVDALVGIVEAAMAAGEIRRADPQLATAMALGIVLQPAVFHLYGRLPARDRGVADAIAATILRALA